MELEKEGKHAPWKVLSSGFKNLCFIHHVNQKPKNQAGGMAQQTKALAPKPDHLSSILGTTWEKDRTDSCKLSQDSTCMHVVVFVCPQKRMYA